MLFPASKQYGFTLLELLVALAIFGMVSVMAYSGLNTVLTTRQITAEAAQQIAELQLAILRISNDLRQAVPRGIRNEFADHEAAMWMNRLDGDVMSWSRAGYRNPAQQQRSAIQRVAYRVKEKKLIRTSWPVLDRAQDSKALQQVILQQVNSMKWRFLDNDNQWQSEWPVREADKPQVLPRAVELTLELENWGRLRRLILLPAGDEL